MDARTLSWGRVTAGTVALFAVVLAFLAGRVKAGGDPTQAKAGVRAPVVTTQASPQGDEAAPELQQPEQQQPQPEPAPLTTQQS